MPQTAWTETDPTQFPGVFSTTPDGSIVVSLQAIYVNSDVTPIKRDIITGITAIVPDGAALNTIRDVLTTAIRAKGLEYGYDVPANRILLPTFQRGI